jgi:hypothetical protein
VAQAAQLRLHERVALVGGQRAQIGHERAQLGPPVHVLREAVPARLGLLAGGGGVAARREDREAAVAGDGEQPRPHSIGRRAPLERLVGAQEGLLQRVLAVLAVAEQVAAEGEERRAVADVERLEGGDVAGVRPERERLVVEPGEPAGAAAGRGGCAHAPRTAAEAPAFPKKAAVHAANLPVADGVIPGDTSRPHPTEGSIMLTKKVIGTLAVISAAAVFPATVVAIPAPPPTGPIPISICDIAAQQPGTSVIRGTELPDVLTGTEERDVIIGLAGNDVIEGLGGNDLVCAGDDADEVAGGLGADVIYGGSANDHLVGGAENDLLEGGDGDDVLEGGEGDDEAFGGEDNDTLDLGAGGDKSHGGPGDDTELGGAGADQLHGDDGNDRSDGGRGIDFVAGGDDDDDLAGGPGNDNMLGSDGIDRMAGGPGVDRMDGQKDADRVDGGPGDDVSLKGGDGDDALDGGPGTDPVCLGADAIDLDGVVDVDTVVNCE